MRVCGYIAVSCAAVAFPALAQPLAFEVVSVKQNQSQDFRRINMDMLPGGRFTATNMALRWLLSLAYNVPVNPTERITGVPDWALQERYDIEARASEGAVPLGLPDAEFRRRMRVMLQGLLADRFKAQVRKDTKEMTVYAVMVGKDGPKMKKADVNENCAPLKDQLGCHDFNGGMGRGLHARAVNMDDLAGYIENWTDHPVINRTGLEGLYAMETEGWAPMRLPPPPLAGTVPNPAARPSGDGDMSDPARPTLFNVLQKLGLDLKQQKGPVDVYVIEHIERPVAN